MIDRAVMDLKRAVDDMSSIPTHVGAASLVASAGWNPDVVYDLRRTLDVIDRKLAGWADQFNDVAAEDAQPSHS